MSCWFQLSIPVRLEPSPEKLVAVTIPANSTLPAAVIVPPTPAAPNSIPSVAVATPAVTIKPPVVALNPLPAVTNPTESTFVTSS